MIRIPLVVLRRASCVCVARLASSAHAQLAPRPQLSSSQAVAFCAFATASSAASCRTSRDSRSPARSSRRSDRRRSSPSRAPTGGSPSATCRPDPISFARICRGTCRRAAVVVQVTPDARRDDDRADAPRGCRIAPTVLAASVAGDERSAPAQPAETEHGHDEVAWRLRHLKRSVLKDASEAIARERRRRRRSSATRCPGLGRAVGHSARLASSLFADLPLNGQFNLLTTTSFDRPQDLFSMNVDVPRSVAYVSLEAPGQPATG